MRDETLHAVLARSTFRSQNVQNTRYGALLEVETLKKCMPAVHAAVAQSTCRSQNVQNTPGSDHCAKHISKSKCTKHTSFGALLDVEMSKKCTPLWCEGHFEVKMYNKPHVRTTFGS